jgi:hypothetical protein
MSMTTKSRNPVHIISETGADMMTLESVGFEGGRMTVQGALMGSWSTKMYVSNQDAWTMILMFLKPQMISYIIRLPFILLQQQVKNRKVQ